MLIVLWSGPIFMFLQVGVVGWEGTTEVRLFNRERDVALASYGQVEDLRHELGAPTKTELDIGARGRRHGE